MPHSRLTVATVLAAALLVSACGSIRREEPETVPDAVRPDGTPLPLPDRPQPKRVQPEVEPRVSPVFLSVFANAHPATTATKEGSFDAADFGTTFLVLEAVVQPRQGSGVGVAGRVVAAPGNVPRSATASVLLGWRQLALEAGLGSRDGYRPVTGALNDSTYQTALLGLRSRLNVRETPMSVHGQYARLFSLTQTPSGANPARLKGWQLETGLTWSFTRWPISADLRYRHEHFQVYNRVQDVTGLTAGLGVLFGRRPLSSADSAAIARRARADSARTAPGRTPNF